MVGLVLGFASEFTLVDSAQQRQWLTLHRFGNNLPARRKSEVGRGATQAKRTLRKSLKVISPAPVVSISAAIMSVCKDRGC